MKTRDLFTLLALGGVIALAACSSDDDDKFASSDKFCVAKAEAACNNLAKKCTASVESCKTDQVGICNSAAAAAASQGRSYHSSQAQACIDSINETYKNSAVDVTAALEAKTATVCERVFTGSLKENAACTTTFECEGSLICDKGICITETKVGLGGQCNNAGAVCDGASYCQQQGQTRFCVAKNTKDQSCGADAPCIDTLRCVSGRCVDLVPARSPCDTDSECAVDGVELYCATSTKTCQAKFESSSAACKDYGL
ncbi:MAG: hypothetical protein JWP97_2346 [Labilithrix sp.]|nr:hypothetical protein [Labilithrix sp.]